MNKKLNITFVLTLLSLSIFAQPVIQWQKSYGGSNFEQPFGCEATRSGGIICGGHSLSNDGIITSNQGDYDWWIMKLDSQGNIVWTKSYGGSLYDKARYAFENPDGSIMAFGSVKSNDGDVVGNHNIANNDYWLLKLDSMGNIIWKKCYGGSLEEGGRSVIRTNDGNYIMAGYSRSNDGDVSGNHGSYDVWLVKVSDADGSIIWQKCFGGNKEERVRSITELPNGDFVFTGNAECTNGDLAGTITHGGEDVWTARISSTGTLIWSTQYGSPGQDRAYYCTSDLDGNILVVGKDSTNGGDVADNHGASDAWILKLNQNNGSIIWQKSFGGAGDDEGFRIDPNPDGGYIVAATSESVDGDATANKGLSDYWIFKLDSNRNIVWQKNYGGGSWDHMNDIVKMPDGGYAGIGFTSSKPNANPAKSDITYSYGSFDMWVVKIVYCDPKPKLIANGPLNLNTGQSVTLSTNNFQSANYLWSNGATTSSITVNTAGTYFVTITNTSVGCSSISDSAIVTTPNSCNTPLNISSTSITGTTATINWTTWNNAVAYNIQYRIKGTTTWSNTTLNSNSGSKILTGLSTSKQYQYKVRTKCHTNPNVFSAWSAVKTFTTLAAKSINDENAISEFSIYPNPANDKITIAFENNLGDAVISIKDISGKIFQTQKISGQDNLNSLDIEIDSLPNGIYLLEVKTKSNVWNSKFVKKSDDK